MQIAFSMPNFSIHLIMILNVNGVILYAFSKRFFGNYLLTFLKGDKCTYADIKVIFLLL